MTETHPNPFIHHIRQLIGMDPSTGLTDGQLLERFRAHRDETAVEVLVRRYGPLVLGVCRRVLHNADAAEDAFQATFLVLVRKAPSLICYQPLGGWLYRVAYRLALRARANEARRRQCEAQAARIRPTTEDQAASPSDLAVAIEEELDRLPQRHRDPLVLCYFEGKTNEQAAQILGCPLGSMSARLAQARERLRACLARRGFVAGSVGVAAALTAAGAKAAVPLPLLANTVRAAVWFASEEAGSASFVSNQAVALARGACHAMFVNKLKIAVVVLLAVAMLGTGTTLLLKAAPQADPPTPSVEQPPPEPRPDRSEQLPIGVLARMGSTQLRHGDAVFFAAYMPDGERLVAAGKDGTVRLWDLATGKEIRRFDWGQVRTDSKPKPAEEGIRQKLDQRELDDIALSGQAALSSNGKLVAASRGGVVCLWDTATGKQLHQLQTGQTQLVQLAFAADDKSLATVGPRGQSVAVWEVATGQCLRRSQVRSPADYYRDGIVPIVEQNAIISPGLKYLAYQWRDDSGVRWIKISDLATNRELAAIHMGGYGGTLAFCFSADDKTLVWDDWYSAAGVVFSDVATGKELRRVGDRRRPDGSSPDRSEQTLAVALSSDGTRLAVCRQTHTIELWDLASGKHVFPVGKPTSAQLMEWFADWMGAHMRPALAFSPDAKKLVCSLGGAVIRQFHVDTGKEIPGPGIGPRGAVSTLALSADGRSLCTFGSGDPARFWDLMTGKETSQREIPTTATHAGFAGEGRFAFAVGNYVTLCGPGGRKSWKIANAWPPLEALALSPDGVRVATRNFENPEVHVWDATGKQRYTLGRADDIPPAGGPGGAETAGVVTPELVFSPDGRHLAGAGPRRQLCLWDVARGTLLWEVPPQAGQAIERFVFCPSGHCLATIHADRTVTLYEAATGGTRARLGKPDLKNRRVYFAYDYYGKSRLQGTRRAAPVCLAFSTDGRYLAMAKDTPTIYLWDMLAGREVGQLKGHEGSVVSLLFAPDGKHLFSGGTDTTALTWDLTRLTQPAAAPSTGLEPPTLDALWADLASQDAGRGFDAMCQLSAFPSQAVTLLQEHLHPAVQPDPKRLVQLLGNLESDRLEQRRQAEAEFLGLGEWAEPVLRKALADEPPLGLRQRLERLRDKLRVPALEQVRALRAVELLELLGSPDARQLLQGLASGEPDSRLTREAKKTLERLSK
jgi:RNA polymerase sigma factor (sigma-70 family)